MRFIHLYLIGYYLLVVGAGLALWQAGALARVPGTSVALAVVVVVGLGVVLALTSSRPTVARD